MKKIFKVCLVLVTILFVFTGCASTPSITKEERFEAIMQSSVNMMYADVDTTVEFEMILKVPEMDEPLVMNIDSTGHMILDFSNKENYIMYADMNTAFMGANVDMEMYYYDNYQYINTMGMKIKTPVPFTEALSMTNSIQPMYLQADDMKELKMKKDGSNYVFSYEVSKESLDSYISEIFSLFEGMDMDLGSDLNFSIEYLKGTLTADKNNSIIAIVTDISMNIEIEGQMIPVTMINDSVYNSFNEPVTIDFPNFDEYTEEK